MPMSSSSSWNERLRSGSAFRSQGPGPVRTMTHMTLTGVLVFGFVMIALCCIAYVFNLALGPRLRPGTLMSLVIIVLVVWRLSDFLQR
jgi:hypothetical protein